MKISFSCIDGVILLDLKQLGKEFEFIDVKKIRRKCNCDFTLKVKFGDFGKIYRGCLRKAKYKFNVIWKKHPFYLETNLCSIHFNKLKNLLNIET
jgi:hypothetical protein